MTHFSKEEWISYKRDLLSEEETITMEDHLYTCHTCMDMFLSLIDSEELDLVVEMIPSDFTKDVMKKIDGIIPIAKATNKSISNKTRKKKMIENIFMYYIAVASVVLVLTAGGVFTKMTEIPIENIKVDRERTTQGIEKMNSFSEKIANSTNNFINNFGIKNNEENHGRLNKRPIKR